MSEATDPITRAEAIEIASEIAQAVARELRAEFTLALTPPAPAEDEGSTAAAMAIAAYALASGTGSAAEFKLAMRSVFGPHTAVVLTAVGALGPRIIPVKEATA